MLPIVQIEVREGSGYLFLSHDQYRSRGRNIDQNMMTLRKSSAAELMVMFLL
jgi:hypothetical protein